MPDLQRIASSIASVAKRWTNPEHSPRAEAVRRTLSANNRFTEEAIAFAINQQMHQLSEESFLAWIDGRVAAEPHTIGLLAPGNVPFAELQDFLAIIGTGHRFLGVVSSKSPHLLPAFSAELQQEEGSLDMTFGDFGDLLDQAEGVIATGSDETMSEVSQRLNKAGITPDRRLIRGHRYSVALVDGRESEDDREALAEDVLLHEGLGCRNVALIWAPSDTSPDPYLNAFANFRAVFPAHERTPGSLKMHQAMLAAVDAPHAYADGLEFLMSKGDPIPQAPGHVRWVEYQTLDEVERWINQNQNSIQAVVTSSRLASKLTLSVPEFIRPGNAQRPALDWPPDGIDTVESLVSL